MKKPVVLIVDNHPEFLATRSELVEAAGYKVITAGSPDEARACARNKKIDLAVIDLRLHDDGDPEDFTGIFLAEELHPLIPVILQTDFATVATARESLRRNESGESIADDYISKGDGSKALISSIKKLLVTRPVNMTESPVNVTNPKETGHFWNIFRLIAFVITILVVIVLVALGRSNQWALLSASVLAGLQVILAALSYFRPRA
jgi:DNA-binding NtrC family response regulator